MTPYNKQLIGELYENHGQEIDRFLDYLKMGYNTDVTPQDDFFQTGIKVYEKSASLKAIEDVRHEFRSALKKSV